MPDRTFAKSTPIAPSPSVPTDQNHQNDRCKILAKKGFLTLKNVTSGLAILLYSQEFQLGVLFQLSSIPEAGRANFLNEEQTFAKSAMAMILSEFQTLGVRKRDLLAYAIGGSASEGSAPILPSMVRQTLRSHGLDLTSSDLGGNQTRSIWMDVQTGRTIIRSEPMIRKSDSLNEPCSVAS